MNRWNIVLQAALCVGFCVTDSLIASLYNVKNLYTRLVPQTTMLRQTGLGYQKAQGAPLYGRDRGLHAQVQRGPESLAAGSGLSGFGLSQPRSALEQGLLENKLFKDAVEENVLFDQVRRALMSGNVAALQGIEKHLKEAVLQNEGFWKRLETLKNEQEIFIKKLEKYVNWVAMPSIPLGTFIAARSLPKLMQAEWVTRMEGQVTTIVDALKNSLPNMPDVFGDTVPRTLESLVEFGGFLPDYNFIAAIVFFQFGAALMRQKVLNLNEAQKVLTKIVESREATLKESKIDEVWRYYMQNR